MAVRPSRDETKTVVRLAVLVLRLTRLTPSFVAAARSQAFVEPFVILLILFINAFVGVWQESNAESALEALKNLQSAHTVVKRNGEWVDEFNCIELVPGDIVKGACRARAPLPLAAPSQAEHQPRPGPVRVNDYTDHANSDHMRGALVEEKTVVILVMRRSHTRQPPAKQVPAACGPRLRAACA